MIMSNSQLVASWQELHMLSFFSVPCLHLKGNHI